MVVGLTSISKNGFQRVTNRDGATLSSCEGMRPKQDSPTGVLSWPLEIDEIPNGSCYGEGQETRVRRTHRTRCFRRFCLWTTNAKIARSPTP